MRSELIIFIVILVANGLVAAWKKHKEAQAKAEAERPRASTPPKAREAAKPRPASSPTPAAAPAKSSAPKAPRRPAAARPATPLPPAVSRPPEPLRPEVGPSAAALALRAAAASVAKGQLPRAAVARSAPRITPIATADPRVLLRDRVALRQAIILGEILGPPRSASFGR